MTIAEHAKELAALNDAIKTLVEVNFELAEHRSNAHAAINTLKNYHIEQIKFWSDNARFK